MRYLTLLLFCLSISIIGAQNVGINNNGVAPDPSAILDIQSLDKGLLIPRTDTSAIVNPATGLMIFQNIDQGFYFYNGNSWHLIGLVSSQLEDLDSDTKITVEQNADEDIIRFRANGYEIARLDSRRLNLDGPGHSIFIGHEAGISDDSGINYATAIGFEAGKSQEDGNANVMIGANAGSFNVSGDDNTYVGASAGYKNTANGNTIIGRRAGFENVNGSNNTMLGDNAGRNNYGSGNVFVGQEAGQDIDGSNLLVIDNTNTTSPLIYGDFLQDEITLNGKLGINIEDPLANIDIKDNDNKAEIRLRASKYTGTFNKYAYAQLLMQGDTISEEGYIIGATNWRYLNSNLQYDTSRLFRIKHVSPAGIESNKLTVSSGGLSTSADDYLRVYSDATFYSDLKLNNYQQDTVGIVFNDDSKQVSAAGSTIESTILRARDTSAHGFMFPQGGNTGQVPAIESVIYYDTITEQFRYFNGLQWRDFQEDDDWAKVSNGYSNLSSRFTLGSLNPSSTHKFSIYSIQEPETAYFRNNGNTSAINTYGVKSENFHTAPGDKYGVFGYASSGGTGTKTGIYGGSFAYGTEIHYGGRFEALGLEGVGLYCSSPGIALQVEGTGYVKDNLGIGIDSPEYDLQINNSIGSSGTQQVNIGFTNSSSGTTINDGFEIGMDPVFINPFTYNHGRIWNKEDDGEIRFGTENQQRLVIDKDGQVGIGTNQAIDSKIHIHKSSVTDIPAKIRFTDHITGVGTPVTVAGFEVGLGVNQEGIILHTDPKDIVFYTNNLTETMRIETDGDLLIGNINNIQQLRMNNGSLRLINLGTTDSDQGFEWGGTGSSDFAFVYDGVGNTTDKRLHLREYFGTSSDLFTFVGNGNMGIGATNPTFKLQVGSNSAAKPISSAWTVYSDSRLKVDLGSFDDGLSTLLKIEPRRFRYNGSMDLPTDEIAIGTIAQDLQKIAPYMVKNIKLGTENQEKEDYLAVDYGAMDFVMINAIKELNTLIEKQALIIETLNKRIDTLESSSDLK